MSIRFATPVIALALLGLSACGGDSSSTNNTAPADADVVVEARDGIAWNQKEFTAAAGTVVLYGVNQSSLPHNLYVLDSNDKVMGEFIDLPSRGADGTRQFDLAAGEYHIVCKIPGHTNMNSTLTVS